MGPSHWISPRFCSVRDKLAEEGNFLPLFFLLLFFLFTYLKKMMNILGQKRNLGEKKIKSSLFSDDDDDDDACNNSDVIHPS